LFILLLLGLGGQSLPGEPPANKVHEHDANLFEIVSPCLLYAQVGVETSVTSGARQGLVIFERDVPACLRVLITLG